MPISSFQVDVNAPTSVVVERLRAVVGPAPLVSVSVPWWGSDEANPPFIGKVRDGSFRIQRDSRRRNSFLPIVWGHIVATPGGTRVKVTMFIHPFVAIFMACWLGIAVRIMMSVSDINLFPVCIVFMIIGVAVMARGFFPEARKARQLLTRAVSNPTINEPEYV
jgi:hypothetical protein